MTDFVAINFPPEGSKAATTLVNLYQELDKVDFTKFSAKNGKRLVIEHKGKWKFCLEIEPREGNTIPIDQAEAFKDEVIDGFMTLLRRDHPDWWNV